MKVKLIKQFGRLKPGNYNWPEGLVKKLRDLGFVEKEPTKAAPKPEVKPEVKEEVKPTPKRKKREKTVYEDKAEKHEPESN